MKVKITKAEWYPVFERTDDQDSTGPEIDVTQEEYDRMTYVFDDFEKMQNMLQERWPGWPDEQLPKKGPPIGREFLRLMPQQRPSVLKRRRRIPGRRNRH